MATPRVSKKEKKETPKKVRLRARAPSLVADNEATIPIAAASSIRSGSEKYVEAIGRRKRASARVRIFPRGSKAFMVNGKDLASYFPLSLYAGEAMSPLTTMHTEEKFGVNVLVHGGGLHAQAHAIRHGLSRALVAFNPEFRKRLKRAGFLTRDARKVERKKPGLKKARRAPQWQKR